MVSRSVSTRGVRGGRARMFAAAGGGAAPRGGTKHQSRPRMSTFVPVISTSSPPSTTMAASSLTL